MVRFLLLFLPPVGYCALYIAHSVRQRRLRQAAAVSVPLIVLLALAALLLAEYVFFK